MSLKETESTCKRRGALKNSKLSNAALAAYSTQQSTLKFQQLFMGGLKETLSHFLYHSTKY